MYVGRWPLNTLAGSGLRCKRLSNDCSLYNKPALSLIGIDVLTHHDRKYFVISILLFFCSRCRPTSRCPVIRKSGGVCGDRRLWVVVSRRRGYYHRGRGQFWGLEAEAGPRTLIVVLQLPSIGLYSAVSRVIRALRSGPCVPVAPPMPSSPYSPNEMSTVKP